MRRRRSSRLRSLRPDPSSPPSGRRRSSSLSFQLGPESYRTVRYWLQAWRCCRSSSARWLRFGSATTGACWHTPGIAQAGYALIAIALPMAPLAVFFGSTYALAATGTFLAAAAFERVRPEWDGSVAGLAGLGRRAPLLSGAVAVLLLSLAGLPPFLGFWAKLIVFATAMTRGVRRRAGRFRRTHGHSVAQSPRVSSDRSISLGYYGAILRSLYFDTPRRGRPTDEPARVAREAVATAVVVVLAGRSRRAERASARTRADGRCSSCSSRARSLVAVSGLGGPASGLHRQYGWC